MACNSLNIGRALPCTSSVGGIKAIYVQSFGSLGALTIVGGEITALGNDGGIDLLKYDLEGSNGLEQAVTASTENGSVYYEQTLTMTLKKLDLASQNELINLIKSRMQVFIEDQNGNFFLMGATNGVVSSGGSITTGQAYGDLSGFSALTFTAQETLPAFFVVDAVVTGNTDSSQIQPA